MAEQTTSSSTSPRAPRVVSPTNRINVAFPWSKIQISEPSEELRQLAALVVELAAVVDHLAPSPESQQLSDRAQALVARLR